mgnify:CR=1 FL=1
MAPKRPSARIGRSEVQEGSARGAAERGHTQRFGTDIRVDFARLRQNHRQARRR